MWGYGGSGPAQAALAILLHVKGKEFALANYQTFEWAVLATIPMDQEFDIEVNNEMVMAEPVTTYPKSIRLKLSELKPQCTNDRGKEDHYLGKYKCPICGNEVRVWYPFNENLANLLFCAECDKYFKF
jgi:hypothetical protein